MGDRRVRQPAVAGFFYPADPSDLRETVRSLLAAASVTGDPPGPVRAVIAPHAGYVYSGPVAAGAFARLAGRAARRVVLVGPSHFVPVAGLAVAGVDAFLTPLGELAVDVEAERRALLLPAVRADPAAHRREHSLEVEMPFLQEVQPATPVVALAVGLVEPEPVEDVLDMLVDNDTLLVVSSDLSHYLDHATAQRLDAATASAIVDLRPDLLTSDRACGVTGIQAALLLARRRGWSCRLLDLRTSADTAGDPHRVVGYGAFGFW